MASSSDSIDPRDLWRAHRQRRAAPQPQCAQPAPPTKNAVGLPEACKISTQATRARTDDPEEGHRRTSSVLARPPTAKMRKPQPEPPTRSASRRRRRRPARRTTVAGCEWWGHVVLGVGPAVFYAVHTSVLSAVMCERRALLRRQATRTTSTSATHTSTAASIY